MKLGQSVWAVVQVVGRQGSSLLIFYILSRLLAPKDFGLLGMAVCWIGFVNVFSELGFSAALIQRKELEEKHISTTFYLNVILGLLLTVVGIGVSYPAALFFDSNELQPIISVLSVSFLINSLSLTQMAIAQRELQFSKLAIRDFSASVMGGFFGVVAAYLGYGVWSLVIQNLITSVVSALMLWRIISWRPRCQHTSYDCLKDLWPYSSKIFYFNLFKYLSQNVDKVLIGYFLGPVALGLYTFAFRFVLYPVTMLVGSIGNYLFPKFSRHQTENAFLARYFVDLNKITNAILVPVLMVWALASEKIVLNFFGSNWLGATQIMKILAVIGLIYIYFSPVGHVMKALNKPDWLFKWAVFITFVTVVCIIVSAKGTIETVGFGLLIANLIGLPVVMYIMNKLIGITWESYKKMYASTAVSSITMGAVYVLMVKFETLNSYLIPVVLSLIGYVFVFLLLEREFMRKILNRCYS